jgi:hypothetical protein
MMGGVAALVAVVAACGSGVATPPVAPSGIAGASAATGNADLGLKAQAPAPIQPRDRVEVGTLRPALEWQNAKGKYVDADFTYELELYRENDRVGTYTVGEGTGERTNFTVPDDLDYGQLYRWRVRARFMDSFTPFSGTSDFLTPPPPYTPGQPFGPQRSMGVNEAFSIIVDYHNAIGADLGSASSRESRVQFFFSAVALVHYGHPVYNPKGGDRGWCVKDAGGGRPPSDDVLVDCASRDSWDLVGGAGGNGYSFHLDYIGRLPGDQNVYPPPMSFLPK